jgi:mannitol/fructose-specific phosphotransferase system IIA component (Ntr-type)
MPRTEPTGHDASAKEPSTNCCEIRFTQVFHPDRIKLLSNCGDMLDVIAELVDSIAHTHRMSPAETKIIVDGLTQRQQMATFALGKGLAFPHIRTPLVDDFAGAIGITLKPMDFNALDSEPTRLIFLVLSPWDQRVGHVRLLSRLVTLADDKAINSRIHHTIEPVDVWNHLRDLDDRTGTSNP